MADEALGPRLPWLPPHQKPGQLGKVWVKMEEKRV